jgi:adenylate cyclase
MDAEDHDRWAPLWADPAAAADLLRRPDDLAAFVAFARSLVVANGELTEDRDELATLHEATLEHAQEIEEQLAVKIDEVEARNQFIRGVFGRYITDDVVDTLLASPDALQLGGERREITVLLSDLRGFSSLCERLSPEQVVAILNTYLGAMAEVIDRHRGSINEFLGDAILAIFGAPIAQDDHAERAVACALEMQMAMDSVNITLQAQGLPAIEMGIGVHTGECVVGNIGSDKRAKYGIVGTPVNLASRIESYTVGGQVLVSEHTAGRVGDRLRARGSFRVLPKGAREALTILDVRGLVRSGPDTPGHLLILPDPVVHRRLLAAPVAVRFIVLEGKDAGGEAHEANLVSIDDRGDAELAAVVVPDLLANLKVNLPGRGVDDEDAYSKVVARSPEHGSFRARLSAIPPRHAAILRELP